jgi:glutaredoxin
MTTAPNTCPHCARAPLLWSAGKLVCPRRDCATHGGDPATRCETGESMTPRPVRIAAEAGRQ